MTKVAVIMSADATAGRVSAPAPPVREAAVSPRRSPARRAARMM